MYYIYSVEHYKEYSDEDYTQSQILGIFSSKKKAETALKKYQQLPGFQGATEEELAVYRSKIGLITWDGGYCTMKEFAGSYGMEFIGEEPGVPEEVILDIPHWAKDQKSKEGETSHEFAARLMEAQYPQEIYPKGPSSEFFQIKRLHALNQNPDYEVHLSNPARQS